MKKYWLLLLLCFVLACENDSTNSDITNFIPEHSSISIKSNNIKGVISNLRNNDFTSIIEGEKSIKKLKEKLQPITYLNTENEVLISIVKMPNDSSEFSIATRFRDSLFDFGTVKNFTAETLKLKKIKIQKLTIENQTIFTTVKDSVFLASTNQQILELLYNKKPEENESKKLLESVKNNASLSILINSDNKYWDSLYILNSVSFSNFTDYTLIDADITQDQILLNGISKTNDSTESLINIFKNSIPQENKLQKITPADADGFLSLTFDTFKTFSRNLAAYRKDSINKIDSLLTNELLFDMSTEVGVIYAENQQAFVLNSLDELITNDALSSYKELIESYRDVSIYSFNNEGLFKQVLYPFVTQTNYSKYCIIDNYFIFSDDVDLLKKCIASYQNNTTLINQGHFVETSKNLSNASSLLLVVNKEKLSSIIAPQESFSFNGYKTSAFQCTYDSYFAHLNVVIKKAKSRNYTSGVTEVFNIKLDTELLNTPQFVTNHNNKQQDIVVQDVENNLYLISNKGEILWKKKLDGAVLGQINQVDIYKNGRLQLAFTTPNRLYVLDRNGKDVTNFPLKFNDAITQPLAVFDYDKNRNYRLLVTQGNNVLMYNLKAKIVSGFNFKSAGSTIITQPQHFRIGTKDFITIKTKEKLFILDRRGSIRVKPKQQFSLSSEPIFLYKDNFTTTDTNGNLIAVDRNGNVSTQNINLNDQHHIYTTSKTLVTLTDNKLTIKGKTYELDFGIYTAPKIYYINDKIYVTTTDLQTNKVYLFDSQAKLISNFPVYGSSTIDMQNADRDHAVEIVVKSESDGILLYEIH